MTIPSTESVSQLFAEHYRRVLLAAHRITGSMADAEDIAQGLFLRLASAERPIDNIGSYLHRAAINGALDLLRRRKTAATEPLEQAKLMSPRPVEEARRSLSSPVDSWAMR